MKLVHSDIGFQVEFEENKLNTVVIENQSKMCELIGELYEQIESNEGRFVLSDKENILDISKNIDIIVNPFALEINNKKVINKLYSCIDKVSREDQNYLRTQELQSFILKYLENLCSQVEYNLQIDYFTELNFLYKAFNIKISEDEENLTEKILNYICILSDLCGINCFVLVNMKDYFSLEDYEELIKSLQYRKVFILLIESRKKYALPNEVEYIIDKDLCEIY